MTVEVELTSPGGETTSTGVRRPLPRRRRPESMKETFARVIGDLLNTGSHLTYTYAQNPSDTFPRCQLVANLLATRQTILTCQDVTNKSATSWQQVVVMEFGKRHDTTYKTDF